MALSYLPYPNYVLKTSFFLFTVGVFLFSGSLYGHLILGIKSINYLAPMGGISLMLGWLSIAYMAFVAKIKTK